MTHNVPLLPRKGVVYTPEAIADEVTRVALESFAGIPVRILEPSVGEGAFLKSLVSREISGSCITAIDIDDVVIRGVRDNFRDIDAIHADFLDYALGVGTASFDLVIGNPPFVKRADYSIGFRAKLPDASGRTSFPAGDMKNAWAVFVVVTADLIVSGGVLALLLPHQFLTAQYGRAVQLHLMKKGFELDVYAPDSKAFSSIEQDAIVMIARRVATGSELVRVNRVSEFVNLRPSASATVNVVENKAASIDVKSVLLDKETTDLLRKLRGEWTTVEDYCESAAGIVTAANRHFILREDEVERLGVRPWVRKILQKGSHMPPGPVLSKDDVTRLSHSVPCNLVDLCAEGSPPLSAQARSFIEDCEGSEIHKRYKCQRRSPWYNIPIVPAGDGLFFKRANVFPRLYVNEASILATDAAYQVRMIDGYDVRDLCFSFYNSITLLFAEVDGRSYFGGVLELTPTEFRELPLHLVRPTREEFAAFENAFAGGGSNVQRICAACDQRLREELGISDVEMRQIRQALLVLRRHRRRHTNGVHDEVVEHSSK